MRIAPHPGRLKQIKGVVPHPQGDITVELQRDGINYPDKSLCWGIDRRFRLERQTVKPSVNPIRF